MRKNYLMTPGPTPVPPEVLLEMAMPLIHHRTPQYQQILKDVNEGLKVVFKTKNDVMTLTASGTGAMEASVINFLSPSDNAIVVRGGKFGERFGEIIASYGATFVPIDVTWGKPVDPKAIKDALVKNPNVKAVYTTLCETSTGVLNDIRSIGEVVGKTDAILVVDAISGLGADDLETDRWGVDCVVSGSQKGLMLPPGLAFIASSEKAWRLTKTSKMPKFYFDIVKYKKSLEKTDTPWTSAISLIIGLKRAIGMIAAEGIENVLARHKKLAQATRAGVQALGLELYSSSPSNAVTAVNVPKGVDGGAFVKTVRDKYGVTIAGGQGDVKGKIFRIAHLGFMEHFDVIIAISAVETVLKEMGYPVEFGAGVGAAQKVLHSA